MGKLVNKRELALILGVSERSLTEWQRNGLPIALDAGRGASNQYDTANVIAWMIARELAGAAKETNRERLDRLQGDKIEMDLAKARGVLVPIEEVEPAIAQFVLDAVAVLEGLPEKYAPILDAADGLDAIYAALVDMKDQIRKVLSEYEFRQSDPDEDFEEGDAAAAED